MNAKLAQGQKRTEKKLDPTVLTNIIIANLMAHKEVYWDRLKNVHIKISF